MAIRKSTSAKATPSKRKKFTKPETAREILQQVYGYESFQDCQEEAIRELELGNDGLVVVRTGGGKSLIFQIPILQRAGLGVVVSPLISLMHDQVDALRALKIDARVLDSTVSPQQREKLFKEIKSGKVKFLYLSPEQLSTTTIYRELKDVKISLLVVDEAHCIAMWGHDFRREYLQIKEYRKLLGNPQLVALTATAPINIRDEIRRNLGIEDGFLVMGDLDRPNLMLAVHRCDSDFEKYAWLLPRMRKNAAEGKKTIVYARRVRTVEAIAAEFAARKDIPHTIYHGKLEPEAREKADRAFRSGQVPIVVATKALGMGWNIPDIEEVNHFDPPESIDELWQEVGRAGRDGRRAYCTALFHRNDVFQLLQFIRSAHPSLERLTAVWKRLIRSVPRQIYNHKFAETFFLESKFLEEYEGSHGRGSSPVAAVCIARFCEYNLIKIRGSKIIFLKPIAEIEAQGLPFSDRDLGIRKEAAVLLLKGVLEYLRNPGENPRRKVLEYYYLNTLVDYVREIDLESWYVPSVDVLKTILLAVSERDIERRDLSAYLRGVGPSKGAYYGLLRNLSVEELEGDIAQAISMSYVRPFALDDRTFITIALNGRKHLEEMGFCFEPDGLYKNLRRRMHNPANKPVLRDAISGWWVCAKGRNTAEQWWNHLKEFLEDTFDILDRKGKKRITGLELVADFCHKRAIYKQSKFTPDGSGKVGAGVRLTDAKLFVNYLHNNAIET